MSQNIKNLEIDHIRSEGIVFKKGIVVNNKFEIIQRLWISIDRCGDGYHADITFRGDELYIVGDSVSSHGDTKEDVVHNCIGNMIDVYEELNIRNKEVSLCQAEESKLYHISKILRRI